MFVQGERQHKTLRNEKRRRKEIAGDLKYRVWRSPLAAPPQQREHKRHEHNATKPNRIKPGKIEHQGLGRDGTPSLGSSSYESGLGVRARLIRVPAVEDSGFINIPPRLPGRMVVARPFDKILKLAVENSRVQDLFNEPLLLAVYNDRRRGW